MRIILTGGGTGGHVYPALAIAEEIRRRHPEAEFLYVGTEQGLESQLVPPTGIELRTIDITGIDRSSMLKATQALMKSALGFLQAREIIKDFHPDIIVGTGGYVSFPVVLSGAFMDTKTIIHEQNAMPGLANRNLAKLVDRVLITFEESRKYLDSAKVVLTGMPVRPQIMNLERRNFLAGKGSERFTVLAFGGSRGADSINQAMIPVIDRYRNTDIGFIWITGETHYEAMQEALVRKVGTQLLKCHLEMAPYMVNIEVALAVADLAVCRAGAGTICELEMLGLPAIFIPYPYAADNHQEKNARALVEKGAAEMIIDEFLDGDSLYKRVEGLRQDPQRVLNMGKNMSKEARPQALQEIVDQILGLLK